VYGLSGNFDCVIPPLGAVGPRTCYDRESARIMSNWVVLLMVAFGFLMSPSAGLFTGFIISRRRDYFASKLDSSALLEVWRYTAVCVVSDQYGELLIIPFCPSLIRGPNG
jgi:hypothetical protein